MKSTTTLQVDTDVLLKLVRRSVSPNEFAQSFARSTGNAWTDLYLRRPADKQFMLANRLRRELAEQARKPKQIPQAVPSAAPPVASPPSDSTALALTAALQSLNRPPAAQATPPAVAPRDTTPGPGWNLPERRKFRYRLEDVAFD